MVLALDEFEEIERKLTEGSISQDLMPFLRNMMQHRQGITLLFAGTHTLNQLIQDYWSPYFRSAVSCRVSYLNELDARNLIVAPIEDFPLNYEPEAVDLIIEITNCHPCLTQLTCMELVDLKNDQHSHNASVEDANEACSKALQSGDYVFRGIWEWIPHEERTALYLLATAERATAADLAGLLHTTEDLILARMERLSDVGIVESGEEIGRPCYGFQVEMLRRWVVRHGARAELGRKQQLVS